MEKGRFGAKSFNESLAWESGQLTEGLDTPELENVVVLVVQHAGFPDPGLFTMTGCPQGGEGHGGESLYCTWHILCGDYGL